MMERFEAEDHPFFFVKNYMALKFNTFILLTKNQKVNTFISVTFV